MNFSLHGAAFLLWLLLVSPVFSQEDLTIPVPTESPNVRQGILYASFGPSFFLPKHLDDDEDVIAGMGIAAGGGISWTYERFSFGVTSEVSFYADPIEQDGAKGAFRTLGFTLRGGLGGVAHFEDGPRWTWGTLGLSSSRFHYPKPQSETDTIVSTIVPLLGLELRFARKKTSLGGRVEYGYPFFLDDQFDRLRKHSLTLQLYIGLVL